MGLLLPMWSLSLEEQFYVLWPTLLFGLLAVGASRRQLLIGTAAAFVALTAWHWMEGEAHLASFSELLYRPDLRADGLVLGCFVGMWFASPPQLTARTRRMLQAGAWAGAAVLALAFWKALKVPEPARATLLITAVVVATAAVIASQVVAPVGPITAVLANPVARWIGRLSYSLYLVHVPILGACRYLLRGSTVATQLTVYAAGSLAAACVLHWAIERPFLRLKQRRLEPEGVPANTAAAAALAS
jgi:peptidoglycan/LPS O-acetylase OafA/YrhL